MIFLIICKTKAKHPFSIQLRDIMLKLPASRLDNCCPHWRQCQIDRTTRKLCNRRINGILNSFAIQSLTRLKQFQHQPTLGSKDSGQKLQN